VEKDTPGVPWDWVAGARDGTLVIYMGVAEVKNVVEKLVAAGMDPDTPAGVVERGTCSTQRAVTTTLSDLPDKVVELAVKPPALFVIGEVANYREKLQWFQDRPLSGVRVMVTRPADQATALYRHLRELGAEVLAFPTIATAEEFHADEWEAMRRITSDQRWLVFTSENGVRYFLEQWFDRFGDIRGLRDYRIAAAGDGTVSALEQNHITPDFAADKAFPGALAQQMTESLQLSNVDVVRVRGNLGDDHLEKTFKKAGAKVISLHVHRTFPAKWPPEAREKLFAHPPHVVMFTSGSAVEGLVENLEESELKRLTAGATVVSIGPSASKVIRSYGMVVGLESKKHTLLSLVDELIIHHQANPLTR
jgi:uroporphyrinogen III methyltransferase/synthase